MKVLDVSLIQPYIHQTPLDFSSTLSTLSGSDIYLKLENLQKTGSFKVRGSLYKLLQMSDEKKQRGIISASAGNHAQGVAYGCRMLNLPCLIVMPKGASKSKVDAVLNYGAQILFYGDVVDEAIHYAKELEKENEYTFIHPFDDEEVITGQGTLGEEIYQQLPQVDLVLCPVGGGGLISGVARSLKEKNPNIHIIGVQSEHFPNLKEKEKRTYRPTIADGIAVKETGILPKDYIARFVDEVIWITEEEIQETMRFLLERNKIMVEGSGAVATASILFRKIPTTYKHVVSIVSGGNMELHRYIEAIQPKN